MTNNIRNIIQITNGHDNSTGISTLFALCDDNTAWVLLHREWKPLPPIPSYELEIEPEPEEPEYPDSDIEPEDTDVF